MVERQPADDHVVVTDAEAVANQLLVGHQVAVADLHALGQRGGARGVLQEGDVLAAEFDRLEVIGQLVAQAVDAEQPGGLLAEGGPQWRLQAGGGQHQARRGVVEDGVQALQVVMTVGFRRIGRHRDHAGIQAGEEAGDVVRAAVEQQHGTIPGHGALLQSSGYAPGAPVQLAVVEHFALALVFGQKAQGHTFRLRRSTTLQRLHQGAWEIEHFRHFSFLPEYGLQSV
ncbi:hypothetical protein D3C78_565720 [compost metagenome]